MKIENYGRNFEEAKATGKRNYSNPHEIYYFKMRLLIDLNGSRKRKGTFMSVYFQLMKGDYDDFIEWPFDKLVTFTLIHPDDKSKCFKRSMKHAQETERFPNPSFIKPVTAFNKGYGYESFITLEKLHADGFIKNDTICIRCAIG